MVLGPTTSWEADGRGKTAIKERDAGKGNMLLCWGLCMVSDGVSNVQAKNCLQATSR
ncbi:hypothetical protein CPB85DRAFT_1332506 [Mucidula mucida]|nr:hypothetical protein CPB85DRAFT_1332506 [Mucidula mucida]